MGRTCLFDRRSVCVCWSFCLCCLFLLCLLDWSCSLSSVGTSSRDKERHKGKRQKAKHPPNTIEGKGVSQGRGNQQRADTQGRCVKPCCSSPATIVVSCGPTAAVISLPSVRRPTITSHRTRQSSDTIDTIDSDCNRS